MLSNLHLIGGCFDMTYDASEKALAMQARRPWLWVWLFMTVGAGIAFGVSLYVLNRLDLWLIVPAGIGGFNLLNMIFRTLRAGHVVLWLRRFHGRTPARFPMQTIFMLIGVNWFQVLTIQDSRFRFSFLAGASRSLVSVFLFVLLIGLPGVLIALAFAVRLTGFESAQGIVESWGAMTQLLLTAVLLFGVGFGPLFYGFLLMQARRKGVERLTHRNARERIAAFASKIRRRESPPLIGMKIYKCEDSFWQDAVAAALEHASAAVIDVSEVNDNVAWEIQQSLSILGPSRIIVTYPLPMDVYLERAEMVPEEIIDRLSRVMEGYELEQIQFCPYPEPLPVRSGKAQLKEDVEVMVAEEMFGAFRIILDSSDVDVSETDMAPSDT